MSDLSETRVRDLRDFDTPAVVNGLKRLGVTPSAIRSLDRLSVRSVSPSLPPLIGYAATQRLSTRRDGPPGPCRSPSR